MGRPPIEIDSTQVEKLAQLGCKNQEIADYFGCSPETIERRFAPELTKGRSEVRMSLRRWQLEAAKKGNVVMLIWLGKQMLGQFDKQEVEAKINTGTQTEQIKDVVTKLTAALACKSSKT